MQRSIVRSLQAWRWSSAVARVVTRLNSCRAASVSRREELEFLPAAQGIIEAPPSALSRGIIYAIMLVLISAGAWAFFGRVDVVAVAQGRVIPSGRSKLLQTAESGTVRAILVREGDRVRAGQVLLELDATEPDAEIQRLRLEQTSTRVNIARLQAQLAGRMDIDLANQDSQSKGLQLSLLISRLQEQSARIAAIETEQRQREAEAAGLLANVSHLEAILPLIDQRVEAQSKLAAKGAGPRLSAIEAQRERLEAEHALLSARERHREALEARAALSLRRQQAESEFRSNTLSELAELQQREAELEQLLIKAFAWRERFIVRSPVDGTIQDLAVRAVGSTLVAGQGTVTIVPSDVPLIVEAWIENKDAGSVRVGQEAAVKVEAFDWLQHGIFDGRIIAIAPEARPPAEMGVSTFGTEQSTAFAAQIELYRSEVNVGGQALPLQSGMTVAAEVKLGRRRIIDFILDPVLHRVAEAGREH